MNEDYDPREYAAELFHWMEQNEPQADDAEVVELYDSDPFEGN